LAGEADITKRSNLAGLFAAMWQQYVTIDVFFVNAGAAVLETSVAI